MGQFVLISHKWSCYKQVIVSVSHWSLKHSWYLIIGKLEFNLAWFALWVDFYKKVYFWQYSYFPLISNIYLEIHFNAPLGPLAGWCQLRSALDRVNDVDVGSLSSSSRPWGSRSNLEEPGQSCLEILDVGPPILLTSSGIDHKVGCVLPTKHKNVWEHYYLLSAQYSDEWLFAICNNMNIFAH